MKEERQTNRVPYAASARTNGAPAAPSRGWQKHLSWLLLLPDLLILYVAFVGGFKARLGEWVLLPNALGFTKPMLLTIGVYAAVLIASGLYRMPPRAMHLSAFLRVAASLLVAWTISVTLVYLLNRAYILPRSVTALHCLLSMIGILGLRALIRQGVEWRQHNMNTPPPDAPSIGLDDLVSRSPVQVDVTALCNHLAGRTVLVTGAGGSIGTELTHQLINLNPFRLVLVDVSEYNLFQLENALRKTRFDGEIEFCIADVRDETMMQSLFANFQPDVVLHAAAYKHVPLMERHPVEAFRNNTLATVRLLHLSEAHDAEQFIFVSTDKAVEPSSVLGATKRLAEWYVQVADSHLERKIVRFGNVFGSQGSVVPRFQKQLAAGGPARVTHPAMERYFMSAHEACSLILQTMLLDSAPVYIFEMGEPVHIQHIAEQLICQMHPHADPTDLIEYTGIRPGEKLKEKLWTERETPASTEHPSILGLEGTLPYSRTELDLYLRHLEELGQNHHAARLRKALFATDFDAAREALD